MTDTDTTEHRRDRRRDRRRRGHRDAADAETADVEAAEIVADDADAEAEVAPVEDEAVAEAAAEVADVAEPAVDDEVEDASTRTRRTRTRSRHEPSPWMRPGPVVRRPHAVRLREEGQVQPRGPHPVHEHGGEDLRGRHPHGGRRRVQGRPQAGRPAQGLPRLPAGALRDGRRQLVRHPQHARASPGSSARAASARSRPRSAGGRWTPSCRPRATAARRPGTASPSSSTTWARASGSRKGPFADFTGSVAEINVDHLKLKVLVNIFGRETLVEMDFSQVAKI